MQNYKDMEKIHVKVDWCEKNYGAVTECEALNGVVAVTAKTYDALMADLADAVQFHVEGCVDDGDRMPEWLVKGEYVFDIELGTAAEPLRQRAEEPAPRPTSTHRGWHTPHRRENVRGRVVIV